MAIERISLYDPTLNDDELWNLRFAFWRTIEDLLSPGYFPEFAFGGSIVDENATNMANYVLIPQRDTPPPFAQGVYYQEPNPGVITPLNSKPDDWDEAYYTDYYTATQGFCILTEGESTKNVFNALGNGCGVTMLHYGQSTTRYFGKLQAAGNQWYAAYKAKHGIMIVVRDVVNDVDSGVIIIAKTNNGDLAILNKEAGEYKRYVGVDVNVWSMADDIECDNVCITFMPKHASGVANASDGQVTQTVLCPIPTHPSAGTISYLKGVYALPWSQYRESIGEMHINGATYLSNGYYAILDE